MSRRRKGTLGDVLEIALDGDAIGLVLGVLRGAMYLARGVALAVAAAGAAMLGAAPAAPPAATHPPVAARAEVKVEVRVAVAANFTAALAEIARGFERASGSQSSSAMAMACRSPALLERTGENRREPFGRPRRKVEWIRVAAPAQPPGGDRSP